MMVRFRDARCGYSHDERGPGSRALSLRWLRRSLVYFGILVMCWASGCGTPEKTCQSDADCEANQTCKDSACVAKDTGCSADSDCGADQICKDKACVAKPKESCTDADCGDGELCFQKQRCVETPKSCKTNGDCGENGLCVGESSTVCMTRCDASTANADKTHSDCWGGWGHCEPLSAADPSRGVCVPPRGQTQPSGADCKSGDYSKDSYNDCTADLRCIEGKCLPNCDPTKGTSTNSVCPAGTFCKGEKDTGLCEKLPDAKEGPKQLGEGCSNRQSANFCDGKKGLVCVNLRCVKACDPRKGTDTNATCGADFFCEEEVEDSHLGGVCSKKPTQKKDEPCSTIQQLLCLKGLRCSGGRCLTECDPAKTGECESGEVCSRLGNVCVVSCDPAKGGTANPTCPVGSYCLKSTAVAPGYCRPLPNFDEGTLGEGESCTFGGGDKICDGKKELFCYRSTCIKACDLRKGKDSNPNCKADDECVETTQSPLGGICLPKATQKENEVCGDLTNRCLDGMNCSSDRCARACDSTRPQPGDCKTDEFCVAQSCRAKCDPTKGEVGNASCPARYACIESANQYKPGYCRPLPLEPAGPKKRGEQCVRGRDTDDCDGKAGLTCRLGKCEKACDPSKGKDNNPDCDSGQTCDTQLQFSFLGGVCVTTPTQKENEVCNDIDKLCLDGLHCNDIGGTSYCLKSCSAARPDDCPSGTTCQRGSSGRSVCVPARGNTRKLHESCKGAPGTPEFDDCGTDLLCVKLLDATTSHCLPSCAPPKMCTGNTICTADPGGLRVCADTCQTDADCTNYGTACKDSGANKICR